MTGRRQLLLLPESQEVAIGAAAFQEILASETPTSNEHYRELVARVGWRLARASARPDFAWEFHTLASAEPNAFCLPGGKVAVYEGLLPICQTEGGLAVVMSHEVAHALARHGAERMSQGVLVNGVGNVLDRVTWQHEEAQRERLLQGYGVATKYGFVLPYSRQHELEADRLGLLLMARAGYDPREAPRFWHRFAHWQRGPHLPEFASTHPADARRAAELLEQLPQAMALYEQTPEKLGLGQPIVIDTPPQAAPATASGPAAAEDAAGLAAAADTDAEPPQFSLSDEAAEPEAAAVRPAVYERPLPQPEPRETRHEPVADTVGEASTNSPDNTPARLRNPLRP